MQKILVANRGEIAMRVLRSAKKMGIKTVAIYSEADRNSPHVKFADEAVCVGLPPSAQSYLQMDKIIEICKQLHVDGVHPGYGFLSENAVFAQKLADNNITFIGPSAESMQIMGGKISAKQAVVKYGVPLVPGIDKAITNISEAKQTAIEIGFPILIKASAGGGGKGMRIVENEKEFEEQMQRAQSEAQSAFGDNSVFIEKYVNKPRHIEIQILSDKFGNCVYLFERECSIQRRHQKLVEEAPSACLSPELRAKMGEAAVKVAKACNYHGAGTVEFLVNAEMDFYFLEMNTRLQVEHTVSEIICELDLVKEQINIAKGLPLNFTQNDLKINGHAIELRICAEDPMNDFLPCTGKLFTYQRPVGKGIRVDDGYEEGMEISIYYDSLIAKLIVHAENRAEAIAKMIYAIDNYNIQGVENTLNFGKFVMQNEMFKIGDFDTNFINAHFSKLILSNEIEKDAEIAAKLAIQMYEQHLKDNKSSVISYNDEKEYSAWRKLV